MTEKAPTKVMRATESLSEGQKALRNEAINKARSQAKSEIAERERVWVNERIAQLVAEAGFEWTPARTAEEKAADALEAIYLEFPHLRPTSQAVEG